MIRLIILLVLVPTLAGGGEFDWGEDAGGASRDYYNSAARLKWRNFLGDWTDAAGKEQGDKAFGSTTADRAAVGEAIEIDVTPLVRGWGGGDFPNRGIFVRVTAGGCSFRIPSRESDDTTRRPVLLLTAAGKEIALPPAADTYLEKSTYRAVGGKAPQLRLDAGAPALLRFDLSPPAAGTKIDRAVLRLAVAKVYGSGATTIGAFRCSQGESGPPPEPRPGIAAKFPADRGIGDHPSVIFHADFEGDDFGAGWTVVSPREYLSTAGAGAGHGFDPLSGKALQVRMAKGENTALNTLFKFAKATGGPEPEEIYFRYYLRLANDWNQTLSGGKMPGISGTYGIAGWGGRKSDGTDGWSARGQFFKSIPAGTSNPLAGRHPIGTYCYHADMAGQYGDNWVWGDHALGFLENDRWYCVEQFLKLNNPGKADGVLRAWIDGKPAFEKTDIRFRKVDKLKIEQIWMNVYHGGTAPSPHEQHLFIDNVVIAREYIGPAGR